MKSHVYKCGRFLEHMDAWNEARKIIMQHHADLGTDNENLAQKSALVAINKHYQG